MSRLVFYVPIRVPVEIIHLNSPFKIRLVWITLYSDSINQYSAINPEPNPSGIYLLFQIHRLTGSACS